MKKYFFFVLLISFFSIQFSIGQQNYAWRIGISAGINNYYGDLNSRLISNPYQIRKLNPQTFPGKLQANLEYQFSPSWGISLQAGWGSLSGNDRAKDWQGNLLTENPNFDRALNFRSEIVDANLSLVYHFNNDRILRREAKIAPYIYAGAGLTYFQVYGDLFSENGGRYYYWPDQTIRGVVYDPLIDPEPPVIQQDGNFETELGPLNTESPDGYNPLIFQIPIGLGLDFRLSDRFLLGIQGQINYAFSDYVDDVSGQYRSDLVESSLQNYASNPTMRNIDLAPNRGNSNGRNDWYSFLGVSLKYQFGGKVKVYKSPRFYGVAYDFATIDTIETKINQDTTVIAKKLEESSSELLTDELDVKLDSISADQISTQINELDEKVVGENLSQANDTLSQNQGILDSIPQENIIKVKSDSISSNSIKEEINTLEKEVKELVDRVEKLENHPDSILIIQPSITENLEEKTEINSIKKEKIETTEIQEQNANNQVIRNDSTDQKQEFAIEDQVVIPTRGSDTLALTIEDSIVKTEPQNSSINYSQDSLQVKETDSLQIAKNDSLQLTEITPEVSVDTLALPISIKADSSFRDSIQLNEKLIFETGEREKKELKEQISIKPDTTFIVDTVKINEILGLNKAQVFFALGSSKIRKSEEETLIAMAEILKANPKISLLIKGFADPSGNPDRNLILSQKRAEATAYFLVNEGINQDRIRIERFGDTVQRYGEGALDRRVELELIMK